MALIVATTGFTQAEETYYAKLRERGVIVATTFPSGEQVSHGAAEDGEMNPAIAVYPTKARILMMLALTKTRSVREIQKLSDSY